MSRRGRHGRHVQPHSAARFARPAGPAQDSPSASRLAPVAESIEILADPMPAASARPAEGPALHVAGVGQGEDREREHLRPVPFRAADAPVVSASAVSDTVQAVAAPPTPAPAVHADVSGARAGCTVAQLRRFIKSRPWVPMHELRRRFGIAGVEDDVTPVRVSERTLFIGLPGAEARMVAELLGGGDVGYELSLDPDVPVVVGVYPMRPVPRA